MRTFHLHGDMAENFCESINLNVSTIREFFDSLSSNFPPFRKYYLNKCLNGVQYVFVDNNQDQLEYYCHDIPFTAESYHVMPVIEGAAAFAAFAGNFAMGYAMQTAMDKLQVIEDDGTPEYEKITTNSFIYNNNENTIEQGTPIPVVYGQLRVGSKVISSSVQNYDYNYDAADIYTNPGPSYSDFIQPKILVDLNNTSKTVATRSETPESFEAYDQFGAFDDSKRDTFDLPFGGKQEKPFSSSAGNASSNYFVGGKSNELKIVGPTKKSDSPNYARASSSWWQGHDPNTPMRPTLWGNGIDENMRPQSKDDRCIETIFPSNKNHGFHKGTRELTVGRRGKYQKLESLSIYQATEILSEGPIVGLANPITGFEFDNGLGVFPYRETRNPSDLLLSTQNGVESIAVESIKFDNQRKRLTNQQGGSELTIFSKGSSYDDINTTITANDKTSPFYIYIDSPFSVDSADIGEIDFNDDSSIYEDQIVSSNGLFTLSQKDDSSYGEVDINAISSTDSSFGLSPAYRTISTFNFLNTQKTATTINLHTLSESSDENKPAYDFLVGKGYEAVDKTYTISPIKTDPEFEFDYELSSPSDRKVQAKALDATILIDPDGLDFPSETTQYFRSKFSESTDSTFFNRDWKHIPRIYYDGNHLDPSEANLDQVIYVKFCTTTWTTGSSFMRVTTTKDVHLKITVKDYISLANINKNNFVIKGSTSSQDQLAADVLSYNNNTFEISQSFSDDDYRLQGEYSTDEKINYFEGGLARNFSFKSYSFNVMFGSSSIDLSKYLSASSDFSKALFNVVSNATGVKGVEFNARKFIKFGVGTGSSQKPSELFNNLPQYMLTKNCDNFDDSILLSDGSIEFADYVNDSYYIDNVRGFYNPLIYPRVTVFVIRGYTDPNALNTVSIVPTTIEAVAQVSPNGTIEKIHLLKVPDLPVYEKGLKKFFPIHPFFDKPIHGKIFYRSPDSEDSDSFAQNVPRFTDFAIALSIDSSSDSTSLNLRIDNSKFAFKFDPKKDKRLNSSIESNYENHIIHNSPKLKDPSEGAGLFPIVTHNFLNEPSSFENTFDLDQHKFEDLKFDNSGGKTGKLVVELEHLDLNSGYKKTTLPNSLLSSNWRYISTGRPNNVTLKEAGNNITKVNGETADGESLTLSIFPQHVKIRSITAKNKGAGYKPNSLFYAYGMDAAIANYLRQTRASDDVKVVTTLLNFKILITTDEDGRIDKIQIIDPGFNMISVAVPNPITWLYEIKAFSPLFQAVVTASSIASDDNSSFIIPNNHFPRQDLVIGVSSDFLSDPKEFGSINKFFVFQKGQGFVKNEVFENPFNRPSVSPVQFDVIIQGGSLQKLEILGDSHPGYSELDDDVLVKVPKVKPSIDNVAPDFTSDPKAWAYSIFLNDTPIRDKNGYFNFSKFHFDFRNGYRLNGNSNNSLVNNANLDKDSKGPLMKEFKYPCNTTAINYPLYGPRNNGEMDYYYTHTIRNPNVSDVVVSIKIPELHYIYEGDESNVYVNLSPILILAAAYALIQDVMAAGIDAASSTVIPTAATGSGSGSAQVVPCTGSGSATVGTASVGAATNPGPVLKAAALAVISSGITALLIIFIADMISKFTIKCTTLPFLCFKVGEIIKNSGEIWPAKVYVNIEYGIEGETLTKETIAFRGCATNEYVKDIPIENLPVPRKVNSNNYQNRIIKVYRITREMDPVRQGIVEARYKIAAELHSVTEYIKNQLSFPNTAVIATRVNAKDHPNIPNREYLIKGKLIQVPSNYSPLFGLYNGSWDGSFKLDWTSNPAWVIYDLLTNNIYGMGKYGITESQINKWSFYEFAQYCDEKIDSVIDGVTDSGNTPYQERRHMCNLYVDTEREAYSYIKQLFSLYHASLNFSGSQIYITYDQYISEDKVVMLFNNSNVHEDGFNYSSTPSTSRISAVTVDYLDERDNYMSKSEYVEDVRYISEHGYSHIKVPGIGITRKGEAHRLAWRKILSQQLEREIIQFKAGLQASYLKVGDVIDIVDNNKNSKHHGGSILEVIDNRNIKIDIPATVISDITKLKLSLPNSDYSTWSQNNTYTTDDKVYSSIDFLLYICTVSSVTNSPDPSRDLDNWSLLDSSQEPQYEEYEISASNGFQVTFTSDIHSNIKAGHSWFAENLSTTNHTKPYRIKSIKEVEDLTFEIIALEYVAEKYDFLDTVSSNQSSSILSDHSNPKGPDGNDITF